MKPALLLLLAWGALRADLAAVRAEPNLEKRSHLAFDNAAAALRRAKEAYAAADIEGAGGFLGEAAASVELGAQALHSTGKNPSRSPKHFKSGEIALRDLLRKLEHFGMDMDEGDRAMLERVRLRVQRVHEELLEGIMGKKK